MKNTILNILSANSAGQSLRNIYRNTKENLRLKDYENPESVFTSYFKNRHWKGGGHETVSGSGSTIVHTERIRSEIPSLFKHLSVTRMLDAPCGDYNWF